MTCPLRAVLACALVATATGCRSNAPLPLPDAMRSGLSLVPSPSTLIVRPGSSGLIEFRLTDENGQPVPYYPIDFSITPQATDAGAALARLSTDRSLTDENGSAVVEVISDNLDTSDQPADLFVQGASVGAGPQTVEVTVTTNPYSVEIIPAAALDVIGAIALARERVLFYDDSTCGVLDFSNLGAAPEHPRTPHEMDPGAHWIVSGVSGQGNHAVVALGIDANNLVRIAGCLDLEGSSLVENQTITVALVMDRLLPAPTGSYEVVSDIALAPIAAPVPAPVAAIQAAWQEWSRCPLDPARLWLDCTIDALATTASDPNDCMPMSGAEGSLGAELDPRRGVVVPPLATTSTQALVTPCHDRVDGSGNASLEATVDGLFATTRGQLSGVKLGTLPSEIGALLNTIRINSTMQISADTTPNNFVIDHDLTDLGFPLAVPPVSLKVKTLGLPITHVEGILATLKNGQILIPAHGFTLRLGMVASFAFENTSLKSRAVEDVTSLVADVFDLATLTDRGTVLTGCNALDAALSDQIGEPRGSLLGACQTGLVTLAQKLAAVFGGLSGTSLDFYLQGTGPLPLASGLWRADLVAGQGDYSVNGPWTASSTSTGSP